MILDWIDVMQSQKCRGIKGAVYAVNHGAKIRKEDHPKSRLIDYYGNGKRAWRKRKESLEDR